MPNNPNQNQPDKNQPRKDQDQSGKKSQQGREEYPSKDRNEDKRSGNY
jgi:hypothetical protein